MLRKLNDLVMSLERAFFGLQSLKADVERAAQEPGLWPLTDGFLAYVRERSAAVNESLWYLNGALRGAFGPGGKR